MPTGAEILAKYGVPSAKEEKPKSAGASVLAKYGVPGYGEAPDFSKDLEFIKSELKSPITSGLLGVAEQVDRGVEPIRRASGETAFRAALGKMWNPSIEEIKKGGLIEAGGKEFINKYGAPAKDVPTDMDLAAGVPMELKPIAAFGLGQIASAPTDTAIAGLIGGAGKAGRAAEGLIDAYDIGMPSLPKMPGLIKRAEESKNAAARIEAFRALGIPEEKIPPHLLSDDEILLRRADTLATDPWAGGEAYRKAMDPVTGAINQKAASLLDEATGMPPHELGSRVQKEVKAVADKLAKDFGEAYDLEHAAFGNAPASKSSIRNLSKTIQSLADEPGMDDASLRLINKAQRDLEKIKTVDDLKKLKTNLSNSLSDRPTGNEKRVIGQLSDAIQRVRDNSVRLSTKKTSYQLDNLPDQVKEIPDISTASPLEIRKGLLEGGGKPQVSYQKNIRFETPNGDRYRIYLNNDNRVSVSKNSQSLTEPPTHDLSTFGSGEGLKEIKPGGLSIAELPKFLSSLDEDGEVARAFSNAIKERTTKTSFNEFGDLARQRQILDNDPSSLGLTPKQIRERTIGINKEIGKKISKMSGEDLLKLDPKALGEGFEKIKNFLKRWPGADKIPYFDELLDYEIVGTAPNEGGVFVAVGPGGSKAFIHPDKVAGVFKNSSHELLGGTLYKSMLVGGEEIPGISLSMKNKTVATKFWDRVLSDRQFAMGPDKFTRTRKIGNYTFNELVDEARKKSGEIRIRTADGVDLGIIKKEELPKWIAENDKDFSVAKALQKGGYSDIKKKVTFDKEALKPGKELNKMYREGAGLIKKGLGYETKRKEGLLGPVNRLLEEEPSMVRKRLVSTRNPDQNIAFIEAFPEQWEVLRRGELARIKAQVSTKEGKAINPVSLVNELFGSSRGEPRYHPDVLKQIFGPEKYQELLAFKEAVESLPKNYNPSGSAKQAAFLSHLFNPKESAKSLANYGLLKAKSPQGLIKPKKGE